MNVEIGAEAALFPEKGPPRAQRGWDRKVRGTQDLDPRQHTTKPPPTPPPPPPPPPSRPITAQHLRIVLESLNIEGNIR
jgi:hypothetical protein